MESKINNFLVGFENRMKFVNIGRFLSEYPRKENIKKLIPNQDLVINLIVAVFVFIEEKTLSQDKNCTLENIADYLDKLKLIFPEEIKMASSELAKFIVVDVLQRGGILVNYKVYIPSKKSFEDVPLRLIVEEKGNYHLTDDAFDFLFRSKEIDSELDYSVTRFRMSEYMKRDNYEEALEQSRELVNKIRNLKISIEDFIRNCRENITKIPQGQYEVIITRIRNLLETEYDELEEIEKKVNERIATLNEALQNGVNLEDIKKRKNALDEIVHNIRITIGEQRNLINKKMSLSDSFRSILQDSYAMSRYERLNFDKDIMTKLRKGEIPLDIAVEYLLLPLTKSKLRKHFSIENFYAHQKKISQDIKEKAEAIDIEFEENDPIEIRNARFYKICLTFFKFLINKNEFKISEFIVSLSDKELYEFCEEAALEQFILMLYFYQEILITDLKESINDTIIETPLGELNLLWCLNNLPEEYLKIDFITITKPNSNREFSFVVTNKEGKKRRKINMTDFNIYARQ